MKCVATVVERTTNDGISVAPGLVTGHARGVVARDSTPQDVDASKLPLRTTCCIVGGGPGGMVLALLLARQGVPTTLLEMHRDFDRDFRGDTIHPSTLEIMDQLGLAERLLALPHTKLRTLAFEFGGDTTKIAEFDRLSTKFPYIALMPQRAFLDFLAAEASHYPSFSLVMGAAAHDLIRENGVVCGVRFRVDGELREVRAPLTVGADGRFSKIRQVAGIRPRAVSNAMDVLWFRIARRPGEAQGLRVRIGHGALLALLDRGAQWQAGCVLPKGRFRELRAAGLGAFRDHCKRIAPDLGDRIDAITQWDQTSLLSVEASRCPRWHEPGLLLIGDAAHVMLPIFGVGINYAIQDAVETANLLTAPLLRGSVTERQLANVQHRREWPTRVIQGLQAFIQRRVGEPALDGSPRPPKFLRLPIVRQIMPNLIAFGPRRVRVSRELVTERRSLRQSSGVTEREVPR